MNPWAWFATFWPLLRPPSRQPAVVDRLDPEGNQRAVTAAVSVACRRVAP